jgi:hypothetical protein
MDCILSSYTGEWGQWLQRARQAGQESRRARVDVQGPTSAHRTRSKHWCAQLPQPAATFTPCRGSARPGTHEGRARVRSPDMSMTGELLSRHQALVRRWDRSLARTRRSGSPRPPCPRLLTQPRRRRPPLEFVTVDFDLDRAITGRYGRGQTATYFLLLFSLVKKNKSQPKSEEWSEQHVRIPCVSDPGKPPHRQ